MASTAVTVTVDAVDYVYTLDAVTLDGLRYLGSDNTLLLPATLNVRRVYPKRQKSFPGVARNTLKTSKTISHADGTQSQIIFSTEVARRPDVDAAVFTLMRKKHAALLADAEFDGFFNNLSL